jgi:hypothetical protein
VGVRLRREQYRRMQPGEQNARGDDSAQRRRGGSNLRFTMLEY